MDADGNNVVQINGQFGTAPTYQFPSWSPDGKKIAFGKTWAAPTGLEWIYRQNIYTSNPDGSEEHQVTFQKDMETALFPRWFPDGGKLAYLNSQLGNYFIESKDINTGDVKDYIKLTWPVIDGDFERYSISPDGSKIAYSNDTYRDAYNRGREIFIYDINSGETHQLTNNEYADDFPCWSPDGQRILFGRYNLETLLSSMNYSIPDECEDCGLYIMNTDGTNQVKIPGTSNHDFPMGWRY